MVVVRTKYVERPILIQYCPCTRYVERPILVQYGPCTRYVERPVHNFSDP